MSARSLSRDPHYSALQALVFHSENANGVCSTFCSSVSSAAGKPWVIYRLVTYGALSGAELVMAVKLLCK